MVLTIRELVLDTSAAVAFTASSVSWIESQPEALHGVRVVFFVVAVHVVAVVI